MTDIHRKLALLFLATSTYFVAFPDDAQSLESMIEGVLGLTSAVSPWLYGLLAVGVALIVVLKTCGRQTDRKRLESP